MRGIAQQRLTPRSAVSIALVVLLHAALLWLASAPKPAPVVSDNRVWVQLLRAPPPGLSIAVKPPTDAGGAAPPKAARTLRPAPDVPAPTLTAQEPPAPLAAAAAQPAAPATAPNDPEELALLEHAPAAHAAHALPADVLQQSLKAVAGIDRQLRSEHRQDYTAPVDTPRARLAKGIAAAHAAVKPKLFEQARTELISAPNDPKRIYRVTTALGEYCLYYPDKASISANSAASSGLAGFGQPTAGSCPVSF